MLWNYSIPAFLRLLITQHFLQTTTAVTDYTELETHMKDATVRFDAVIAATEGDDALAQNVPDIYLDPVTLSFVEPDYSRYRRWVGGENTGKNLTAGFKVGEASETSTSSSQRSLSSSVEWTSHVDHKSWPLQQCGISCRGTEPLQQRRCLRGLQQGCKCLLLTILRQFFCFKNS